MELSELTFDSLREQIIGVDCTIQTPFGQRLLVYCDYTASGRCLHFVEAYLMGLQRHYANTHTEDDVTGRSMSRLLHQAERSIKECVNAGPHGRIVATGTGATAAIEKVQQILGVFLPPATRDRLRHLLATHAGAGAAAALEASVAQHGPVVFVGPYEHHSNEVSWREGLATVVPVDLGATGGVDLGHLEALLRDPQWQGRCRIGSFSAASNVTGRITPVHEIARLLHAHGALACFDYAASGPYVRIDMNPDPGPAGGDPSLDAVFLSPHKFLGGPGACGVLVFNERIYRRDLAPTVSGGGTVAYVGYDGHDFVEDIEEREKAGTPGVLQMLKAALAFQVKRHLGEDAIQARERAYTARAFARWAHNPGIEILGAPDPALRVGIVSLNLKSPTGQYLHPKFVTTLANDLFGIQSRAGCSCAGPYGHRLLHIDAPTSERYRAWIHKGYHGIKPGWCRVGFHYVMDDAEADYVIAAIDFIARRGHLFLADYAFDVHTGGWQHRQAVTLDEPFSLQAALTRHPGCATAQSCAARQQHYRQYLAAAQALADQRARNATVADTHLEGEAGALQYFAMPACCCQPAARMEGGAPDGSAGGTPAA